MPQLSGKRALIAGVANDHSIAWAIAQAFHREGAELAFTYGSENLERRVRPLAASLGSDLVVPCDVSSDESIDRAFEAISAKWATFDILVHSIAYAPREELRGAFVDTTRSGFQTALEISAYSLVALTRASLPYLAEGGAVLTLSYLGAERAMPGYNVMGVAKAALESAVRYLALDLGGRGIRVNAVSAGPVRTLSSSAVSGFRDMMKHHSERAPLRRNIDAAEVADTAVYLCSSLGRGVTGETIHVDAGYHITGV